MLSGIEEASELKEDIIEEILHDDVLFYLARTLVQILIVLGDSA